MARSKRTLLRALLSVGLIAGLLAVNQVPASAQTTPSALQQYLPNDNVWAAAGGGANPDPSVLSDRQDGTDQAAHLTVVASNDTDRVIWYVCPVNTVGGGASATPAGAPTTTQLGSCERIGEDAEPRTPAAQRTVNSPDPIDEAYDFNWDILPGQEGTRDIVALACIGTGERIEGSNQNCIVNNQEDIDVDDSSNDDTASMTTAGEITTISTAANAVGAGTATPAAGTFQPFPHGSPVPGDGFFFRATTSPDVAGTNGNLGDLWWAIDWTTRGSVNEPGAVTSTGQCTQESSTLNSKTWLCRVLDSDVPDNTPAGGGNPQATSTNQEGALAIYEATSGSGFCAGNTVDCALDVHYVVASERGTINAQATFVTNQADPNDCNPADTQETNPLDQQQDQPANRTNGTSPASDRGSGAGGNTEQVRGCLVDRFGQLQTTPARVTYESTGAATAGFSSCGDANAVAAGVDGILHDHDGNGYYEHCHTMTNNAGTASAWIDNYGLQTNNTFGQPGTQTVRFCTDQQNDQAQPDSTVASSVGHGCADEAAASQATVTKEWVAVPTHVHLVFQGTGDTANPCHTGDQFKENNIGDRDTLLACTMDNADRPSTTNQTNGGRLQWTLNPATSGQQTATRFDCSTTQGQCPPGETDANGQATVSIEAINEGTDNICVQLFTDQGAPVGGQATCVQKRVRRSQETPTTTPPPTTTRHDRSVNIDTVKHVKLNRRQRALMIRGTVNSPDFESCASEVPIKVQIRKGGTWLTRKSDTTTENGVFKVLIRDITGRYRAIAPKYTIEDTSNNSTDICARAADNTRHRHGRR